MQKHQEVIGGGRHCEQCKLNKNNLHQQCMLDRELFFIKNAYNMNCINMFTDEGTSVNNINVILNQTLCLKAQEERISSISLYQEKLP